MSFFERCPQFRGVLIEGFHCMLKNCQDTTCGCLCIDEDNWRNDYPDEEGSTNSMDSELDNCGEYRHRQAHYSGRHLCTMFSAISYYYFCPGSEEEYGLDDYL